MDKPKLLNLKEAAAIAGVCPETVARWGKRHGIAKQMHSKAPWRVDPVALAFVAAGDVEGLQEYQAQTRRLGVP
ncbi:hypothetical protein [Mesorhizobium sp.]|uniref:hypothetical protein n=1 Tax=Mesorhizobium sp. TaxID=1871066 RepID=UPI000FE5C639|nr:hypothetical protein [Mesorhizobium sp.]RWO54149.1 MAG: hypothetical protein EOS14_32295 [Mesorhizobium sp.]